MTFSTPPQRIGIIGCGDISRAYVSACQRSSFLTLAACADVDRERAESLASMFAIPHVYSVGEMHASDVDIVVNLTAHQAHGALNLSLVEAGKHVYSEKPLASTMSDAAAVIEAAGRRGVRVAAAPDRFLASGLQTLRAALDKGAIGTPLAAFACYVYEGIEFYHPRPQSYYDAGCGVALDAGPYPVGALVALLGPVVAVTGTARLHRPERTVMVGPDVGQKFAVEAPTYVSGILEFASGAVATIVLSYDVWGSELPGLEVFGTEGALSAPHSDSTGGPIRIRSGRSDVWDEVPLIYGGEIHRGVGLEELAQAMSEDRPHRASAELGYHVLEILCALSESSGAARRTELLSTCSLPEPMGATELERLTVAGRDR